jgi:malonate-semialdehyde dehydrogenase (acetylating)/methylmalonate-semialdehyde dehydrogenase
MAVLDEPIRGMPLVRNYIDGEWVESEGKVEEVINPATGRTIARVPNSTKSEVIFAVEAAKRAFPDWSRTTPVARARCLFRLKQLLEENFEAISRIQTQEHGKTIDESRGETRRGIENVEVACGIPTLMMGYNLQDVASGIDEYVIPQPLGVFGIIGPFNFPFMIPLWSAPYAVATGNTIVIKPSPEVPLSQMRLAELAEEAGFPPGVWNVVNGGSEAGEALLESRDVEGITFVGSTKTGKHIYSKCGETCKRVIAQGSAKNFMVVMEDCNIKGTIPALMTSFFGNTGQRCLAGANLLIVTKNGDYYKSFVNDVVAASSRIVIGNGLDESVQMGPVKDKGKKERILGFIEDGIREGAKLILDGRTNVDIRGGYPDDCFMGPTIFDEVNPQMKIAREEIFGPVMGIMGADSLDQAISICNASQYGNGDAIFTQNGGAAREFQYRVVSGNVGINVGLAAPVALFPFSGMKDSFFGVLHTQGKEAVRFFTESKVVIQRWF